VAGFISRIQRSSDGKTWGFVICDEMNHAKLSLGFSSPLEADRLRFKCKACWPPRDGANAALRRDIWCTNIGASPFSVAIIAVLIAVTFSA
jgi:hypothetical protein